MTAIDTETAEHRVAGWLAEGYGTWSARMPDGTVEEYQILPAGAHVLAVLMERRPPSEVGRRGH